MADLSGSTLGGAEDARPNVVTTASLVSRARCSAAHLNTDRPSDDNQDRPALVNWELIAKVAQAQSRVCVQAACTADEALALMRARAGATEQLVVDIADDVLGRRIRF